MLNPLSLLLTLSILTGQLIKIPFGNLSMATLLDLSIICLVCLGLFKSKLRLNNPPLFVITAFVFVTFASLSLILTPLKLQPLEYAISFSYTLRFLVYIFLGWFIYQGIFPSIQKNLGSILLYSGISLAILGLLQLIFIPNLEFLTSAGWDPHYFRTVSTFLDPNFAGSYFVLTLILLISTFPHGKWEARFKWYLLFFIFVYLALLTTFSRGAYLTFGISFLILAILNKSLRLFLLTLILSFGLLLGFSIYQNNVANLRNIDRTKSAQFRIDTWQQGITLFEKNPILGVGFNAYRFAIREYNLTPTQFLTSRGSSSNDSSLLHVVATTGILGFLSYTIFLASLFWIGFNVIASRAKEKAWQPNTTGVILISGLGGLLAQSFFANTLFYPFLLIWVILIASLNTTRK